MSIENIGTSPVAEGYVYQVDTITLSSVTPAPLSKAAIISYPAFQQAGATPTTNVIVVKDTTSGNPLVLNTDYTLTASGAGATLTYSVTRISTSSASSNGDTCTVAYSYGTVPGPAYPENPLSATGIAGTAPTGIAFQAAQADTTGTSVAGIGAALPGGSVTDPAAGSQSSSETGSPGSEYKVTQVEPTQYGWPSGSPDTNPVYGGGLPSAYAPVLGTQTPQGLIGSAADPGGLDTTIGGGAVHADGTPPGYRSPIAGIAAGSKDTTLTDILGNQISSNPILGSAGNVTSNVDTSYFGAPAAPTSLLAQADAFASTSTGTKYYMSQLGILPATIIVTDTTTSTVLTLTTDYTVTSQGIGELAAAYIQPVAGTHYTTGDNLSAAYSYGDAAYWDSNVPATPPTAPTVGSSTLQVDVITLNHSAAQALSKTGITTPPAQVIVQDTTSAKTLVMNTDYFLTTSGSGSSLTYTVTRINSSASSTDGDSATVTYSFGNAAYFTSGPVVAVNRGIFVPWTAPPASSANVDYYWIQSNTLGTQWVPQTGQLMFTGQAATGPSGAGQQAGQPLYQSDTFTGGFSSSVPVTLTRAGVITPTQAVIVRDLTSSAYTIPSSGYISPGTMGDPLQADSQVLIYGVDYTVTQSGQGPYATYQVQRVANSVNSANGDTIVVSYSYSTWGASSLTNAADSVTWSSGSATLSHTGVLTPAASLIVWDSTVSRSLAYGTDYTVSQTGTGPVATYVITRVNPGSAGTGASDSLTVYYQYGTVLGSVFTQGMYENYPVIYKPNGTTSGFTGYRFSVSAGNRAGLSAPSAFSDYAVPLNFNAPQPGSQGTTTTLTGLDPANTINPVYRPDGTVRAGTGLGG